jgi:hypothetical protein
MSSVVIMCLCNVIMLVLSGYSDEDKIEDNDNTDYVTEELESWSMFSELLRKNDRELFQRMLRECLEYRQGMQTKGRSFSTESLLLTMAFIQQKMIRELIDCQSYTGNKL